MLEEDADGVIPPEEPVSPVRERPELQAHLRLPLLRLLRLQADPCRRPRFGTRSCRGILRLRRSKADGGQVIEFCISCFLVLVLGNVLRTLSDYHAKTSMARPKSNGFRRSCQTLASSGVLDSGCEASNPSSPSSPFFTTFTLSPCFTSPRSNASASGSSR